MNTWGSCRDRRRLVAADGRAMIVCLTLTEIAVTCRANPYSYCLSEDSGVNIRSPQKMSCANNFLSGGTTPFKAFSGTCDRLLTITSPPVYPFMQLQSLDDAHSPLIQSHGADTAPLCDHLYINIPRQLRQPRRYIYTRY